MSDVMKELDGVYDEMEGSEVARAYSARHGVASAAILTVTSDEIADLLTDWLEPRIAGKTVVEIGGGIGLLALHMGQIASRVFCIEANPAWSSVFSGFLYHVKPKNVSYLFGAAEEFNGFIRGDVAVFCSHSGIPEMKRTAGLFAPVVIDIYGELIAKNPTAFDMFARVMREFV